MRIVLFLAGVAALMPTVALSQAADTKTPENPWYAPCKNGAQTCNPWERDWEPHPGYKLGWLGDDRTRIYLGIPPYKTIKGYPSIWVYSDNKLQQYPSGDRVSLYLIDCRNRTFKIAQQRLLDSIRQPSGESAWEYASPNSFGEGLVTQVCRLSSPSLGPKPAGKRRGG